MKAPTADIGPGSVRRRLATLKRTLRRGAIEVTKLGFDPRRARAYVRWLPATIRDVRMYRRACDELGVPRPRLRDIELYPGDREARAGSVDAHYFHQDLWAARKVFEHRPDSHFDVGSRIDGFISHLLVFCDVTVVDVRPLRDLDPRLTFVRGDATRLSAIDDSSLPSISSLHAVEHFGLGRYGDPIDPFGWRKAVEEFVRVLAPGGRLYLSVPVGFPRVEFHAQRVLDPFDILAAADPLALVSFAAVDDAGTFHPIASPGDY